MKFDFDQPASSFHFCPICKTKTIPSYPFQNSREDIIFQCPGCPISYNHGPNYSSNGLIIRVFPSSHVYFSKKEHKKITISNRIPGTEAQNTLYHLEDPLHLSIEDYISLADLLINSEIELNKPVLFKGQSILFVQKEPSFVKNFAHPLCRKAKATGFCGPCTIRQKELFHLAHSFHYNPLKDSVPSLNKMLGMAKDIKNDLEQGICAEK